MNNEERRQEGRESCRRTGARYDSCQCLRLNCWRRCCGLFSACKCPQGRQLLEHACLAPTSHPIGCVLATRFVPVWPAKQIRPASAHQLYLSQCSLHSSCGNILIKQLFEVAASSLQHWPPRRSLSNRATRPQREQRLHSEPPSLVTAVAAQLFRRDDRRPDSTPRGKQVACARCRARQHVRFRRS